MSESLEPQHHFHTLTGVERVYCLSDLHTDHPANLEWLRDRMKRPPPGLTTASSSKSNAATPPPKPRPWGSEDLLVIAGDISHSMALLEETLACMREPGCHVLFVAGNHEAWRDHSPADKTDVGGGSRAASRRADCGSSSRQPTSTSSPWSSLDKLDQVYETCRRLGVMVDPCIVPAASSDASSGGGSPASSLYIVPLQSWYDGTLSFAPDLEAGFETWPWVDFSRCAWPADRFPLDRNRLPQNLVEHLLDGNRPVLDTVLQHQLEQSTASLSSSSTLSQPHAIMTVSHFLPNLQTLPDWKNLDAPAFDLAWLDHGAGDMSAKFAKVAGSARIVRASFCSHSFRDSTMS
jgi:Calcineurin-like phosphoesterase